VTNISAGIEECFSPGVPSEIESDALRVRLGLVRPFAMYLGVIEPRKQFEGLIRAWARVPEEIRRTHQLLLVAQEPETEHKRLRDFAALNGLVDDDVLIIGRVNDEDLVSLYRLCRLFVFPSLQEGFGLPVLEAMACGAVVVASNASSLPDVVGCADALFAPEDIDDITRLIVRGLGDESFRRAFLAHARQQCTRFSWDATARRTIAVLESIAAKRQRVFPERAYSALIDRLSALPQPLVETEWPGIAQAIAENLPPPETPRLFVDISELAERDARTGIQRVVRAVLLQLLEAPPAGFRVEPVRFDRATDRYRFARRYLARMRGLQSAEESEDELFEAWRGDVFLGLDLVADRLPIAAPWLAQQRRRGVQLAFVAYDTLPLRHPEWWPQGTGGVFERWAELLACEADVVLGISRAVGEDFAAWVRARGIARTPRLGWFHLGADMRNSAATGGLPDDAADTLVAIGRAPAFLVVGTVEPRKGHAQAIAAFELLWQEGIAAHLVIVGSAGWMVEPLIARLRNHPERRKRLFWLEGISDEYLEALYRASDALLAPSEGEGFGLPLIEAAQHGLPIIARELPVFREVAGDRATYFSGTQPNDIAAVIRRWLIAPAAAPQSSGLHWLTWAESTAQLCRALQLPEAPCRSVSRHVA
jgi:glycosyltransferase involved in cell wall biosynthesis